MRGVYLLFLRLEEDIRAEIGALGEIRFEKGIYVYTGSAMNSLESRVARHFSGEKKTHWHIDYLTRDAKPFAFAGLAAESDWECILADTIDSNCRSIPGFGSSDCDCGSHLFRVGGIQDLPETVLTSQGST